MKIHELYAKFPKEDCGYCGSTSCISALRKCLLGKMRLSECIFFKYGIYEEKDYAMPAPRNPQIGRGVSFIRPCPSDPSQITMEVSLAHEGGSPFGYFDMVSASGIWGNCLPSMRISPSLGIAKFDLGNATSMAFSDGRVLVRRAQDEVSAYRAVSTAARRLWAAVNW